MISKYDTIQESIEFSNEYNDVFPDIYTFPYQYFRTTRPPTPHLMTEWDIKRFDILIEEFYGKYDYYDLVLWFNNIEYISRLAVGDKIYLPDKVDIENFYSEFKVTRE